MVVVFSICTSLKRKILKNLSVSGFFFQDIFTPCPFVLLSQRQRIFSSLSLFSHPPSPTPVTFLDQRLLPLPLAHSLASIAAIFAGSSPSDDSSIFLPISRERERDVERGGGRGIACLFCFGEDGQLKVVVAVAEEGIEVN